MKMGKNKKVIQYAHLLHKLKVITTKQRDDMIKQHTRQLQP